MDAKNIERDESLVLDIFSHKVVRDGYRWSKHSEKEIGKGWIHKAESIGEVARLLHMDEKDLKNTVRIRNRCPRCNRSFYTMQLTPLLYNAQGGPQRNERAEILDPDGDIIKGLYGAGECGSIWGHAYQSSTNFAETIVFGRITEKEAARYCGLEGDDIPTKLKNIQVNGA